jgi:hypothetical protein
MSGTEAEAITITPEVLGLYTCVYVNSESMCVCVCVCVCVCMCVLCVCRERERERERIQIDHLSIFEEMSVG